MAKDLFGSLAEPGEGVVGTVRGSIAAQKPSEKEIAALCRLVESTHATYFALEDILMRVPHGAVASENDSPDWIGLVLRPEVTELAVSSKVGTAMVPHSENGFVIQNDRGEHYVDFNILAGTHIADLRKAIRDALAAAGAATKEIKPPPLF
jgi:hypothetical protein